MKVLVLSREFPPYILGGISYHLGNLYNEIADMGHDITILAGKCPQSFCDDQLAISSEIDVVPVQFGLRQGYYVLYPLALRLKLRTVDLNQFDVAFAHTPIPFNIPNIPLITKYHDCVAETREYMRQGLSFVGRIGDSILHPFRKQFDQRSLDVSDHVIFNSNVNRSGWERHYNISSDWSVIHNAVDIETFQPMDTDQEDYVVFVGSTEQKGLSTVLNYANETNRTVHIVGPTETYNQSNIVCHGRVSQDCLSELYSGAVATIHPAEFESFGNIVLESLACGTPVVTTPTCGASELLTEDTGVVTTDIAYGVEKATGMDPTDCRAIAEEYQWSDVSRETINIAQSLTR